MLLVLEKEQFSVITWRTKTYQNMSLEFSQENLLDYHSTVCYKHNSR